MPQSAEPGDESTFVALEPKLFGVAYRMLGSVSDAEDVVQDAYLRWQAADRSAVRQPENFLTTVVVRLSLDLLRSARVRRETYVGPWLPEPLLVDDRDPAYAAEIADTLSMAFLVVLETLSPAERAAFLLHDVFGYDYDGIAAMLDRAPSACRQLVSRARRHVHDRRQRFDADRDRGSELARQFQQACESGDLSGLMELLADDVTVWTDGGGLAKAALRPIVGRRKAARFLLAVAPEVPPTAHVEQSVVNGQPGLLIVQDGTPWMAIALDICDEKITGVRMVANPDKLRYHPRTAQRTR